MLGNDGRIYTSRNSDLYGEPLYCITPLLARDPNTRSSDGNVLNEVIYTLGQIQSATINVSGALKKTVNLTPFNLNSVDGTDYDHDPFDPQYADDIIYGGWGSDFLHGGDGDDAVSGAEALQMYYDRPVNPGNVLKYNVYRAGEFGAYNEYDPWSRILVDPATGIFTTDGSGVPFLLKPRRDRVRVSGARRRARAEPRSRARPAPRSAGGRADAERAGARQEA